MRHQNMKTSLIIISIAILAVVGWLLISKTDGHQNMSPADKTTAEKVPDFALQDYDGETVRRADFAGKPLVINSWAAWCPFCKKELPDFVTVQKEFGDAVVIIAIDRAESLEVAKGYTDEQGTTNDLIFLLDPSDSFYRSIGGFSMPETIFVDRDGFIREHKRGPMDIQEIREKIKQLILQ